MRNAFAVLFVLFLAVAPLAAQAPDKVVILGIDALDKRLMDQWLAEGRLPNLQRLAEQGHYSALESSHPPMSPVAWATMVTGRNPGHTGIFGFLKRREGSYEPELALASPNDTRLFHGPWDRAGWSALGAVGVFALLMLAARLFARRPEPPPKGGAAAGAVLALLLFTGLPAVGTLPVALAGFAGVVAACAVFAASARRARLKARTWVFPLLGLFFAAFAFMQRLPDSVYLPQSNRGGDPFWSIADRHGIRTRVIGAPVTWPTREDFSDSALTTGLATPDAMGTFHTYTLFTEPQHELAGQITEMSGRVERLEFTGDTAQAVLLGPPAKFDRAAWARWEGGETTRMPRHELPFAVMRGPGDGVTVRFADATQGREFSLQPGQWARHFRVRYDLGGLITLHGTVSFKLLAGGNQVRLYATPVNFDPLEPNRIFAISSPLDFAPLIAREYGMYQTIGWAEATSARNDGTIDEDTFLETCMHSFDEKRAQLLGLLGKADEWDLLSVFTYEIDRVSHIMWRHMDAAHPNHDAAAPDRWETAIRDWYVRYDGLVGEVMAALPPRTALVVCSDHGFAPFYRAVNVNRWLVENGYLVLKQATGAPTMEHLFDPDSGYYAPYDWSRTRAYALGLNSIFINLQGREPQGIVSPAQAEALKAEIIAGLTALRDGDRRVFRNVHRRESIWQGPRLGEAGDLLLGYDWGYRVSWQTSLGGADEPVIADNLRNWSGDHCSFDRDLVPGVVFSNRAIAGRRFGLIDVGLSALHWLKVPLPDDLGVHDGRPWELR